MTRWLRRAGRGRDADGAEVTWTVAEGRRGRRWREARVLDGTVVSSLLFETFPDGRFSHLELTTRAGLLTLHPEGDATLHGNTVGPDGVRHVAGVPWSDDGVVLLEGSMITLTAASWFLTGEGGRARPRHVLRIGLDLSLVVATEIVEPDPGTASGLPRLREGSDWPLEV